MSGLLRPCVALGRTRTRYRTEILHERISSVGLTAVRLGGAARIKVEPDKLLSLVQIPIIGGFASRDHRGTDEEFQQGHEAQLIAAHTPLDLEFGESTRMLIIDLTPEQIRAMGGTAAVCAVRGQRRISLKTRAGERLLRMAHFLLQEIEAGELSAPEAHDLATNLDLALIATIAGAIVPEAREGSRQAPGTEPAALRRAERFMRDHLDRPLTLEQIAKAANLSPRMLQRLFRHHRHDSPMAVFKAMRLDRAHNEIEAGRCPRNGLTHLAMSLGFNHMGMFAADYRQRFGRRPSEALRTARC